MSDSSPAWVFASPPFVFKATVAASDIDEFRHANNAAYLRWVNDCAWAHSAHLGFDFDAYDRLGFGFVVKQHWLDYQTAAKEGDALEAATWILSNDGRLRTSRGFHIRRASDGADVLFAATVYVNMNLKTERAARMPDVFRDAYVPMVTADDAAAFFKRFETP